MFFFWPNFDVLSDIRAFGGKQSFGKLCLYTVYQNLGPKFQLAPYICVFRQKNKKSKTIDNGWRIVKCCASLALSRSLSGLLYSLLGGLSPCSVCV